MKIERILMGDSKLIEEALIKLNAPKALLAFLEDEEMFEITIRRSGSGMIPVTYRKTEGFAAKSAALLGSLEAFPSSMTHILGG